MKPSNAPLGPALFGAEVLRQIASSRESSELRWIVDDKAYVLRFSKGHPASYVAPNGAVSSDIQTVRQVLRAFAIAVTGIVQVGPLSEDRALALDTLGEALVSVLHGLSESAVHDIIASRGARWFSAGARFEPLAKAIASSRGPTLVRPAEVASLSSLVAKESLAGQRAWICLVALGGLESSNAPENKSIATSGASAAKPSSPPSEKSEAPGASSAVSKPKPRPKSKPKPLTEAEEKAHLLRIDLPTDPDAVHAALELKKRLISMFDKTHYEVLGVSPKAKADDIRSAYFELAKMYHSDRFSHLDLQGYKDVVEEVFRRISEASRILGDESERSNYDVYLDRKAKGLPTDVNEIMEADNLLQRAKVLVTRGKGINAAPMMERAYELNSVDPEYRTYFAYTRYLAEGGDSFAEVRQLLEGALKDDPKLAIAHDFLGRIARAEGKLQLATAHLQKAVDLNPKNADALRELRLVQMRRNKKREDSGKGSSFLDKLFKR